MAHYFFTKPNKPVITRGLFVGNLRIVDKRTIALVAELFNAHGEIECVLPGKWPTHVYVVYHDEDSATAAITALKGKPYLELTDRVLEVKYTNLKLLKPPPSPLPVALKGEGLVPGLHIFYDFISLEQEAALLDMVQTQPWVTLSKRRVQHYGHAFDYVLRNFSDKLGPLPDWVAPLAGRISALPCVGQELDQLTVNEYPPGIGLAPHVDNHSSFEGPIIILSSASDIVMEFRKEDDHRPLLLPRRSLLVLTGESRYAWQHYIPSRKSDVIMPREAYNGTGPNPDSEASTRSHVLMRGTRTSFTFRKVKRNECTCAWPKYCDSQNKSLPPTRLAALRGLVPVACLQDTATPAPPQGCTPPLVARAPAAAPDPATMRQLHTGPPDAEDALPHRVDSHRGSLPGAESGSGSMHAMRDSGAVLSCSAGTGIGPEGAQPGATVSAADCATAGTGRGERELQRMEEQHVHAVYDIIAQHFSDTRFAIWPKVREFINQLHPGAILADVGCGNGKYFGVRRDIAVLGSDRSAGLVERASRRLQPGALPINQVSHADVLLADALRLPFRTSSCDAVLCIAVLHHISSEARRLQLMQELVRILIPGGKAIITVWAAEQEDPDKTLRKWKSIELTGLLQQQQQQQQQQQGLPRELQHEALESQAGRPAEHLCRPAAARGSASPGVPDQGPVLQHVLAGGPSRSGSASTRSAQGTQGGDYFVPWHLPIHRVSERAGLHQGAKAPGAREWDHGGTQSEADNSSRLEQHQHDSPACIDQAKQTLVYQRYYHLFVQGELEQLASHLTGAQVAGSGYDKSNWVVFVQKLPTC